MEHWAKRIGISLVCLMLLGCSDKRSESHAMATMPPPPPQLMDAYLTDDRDNDVAKSNFLAQNEPIYFVFAASHVNHVPIHASWFQDALDGGSQQKLSEEEVTAADADYNGAFSHRPPPSGWAPGNYHVDIFFGSSLVHTEHFTIEPPTMALASAMPMESMGTAEPTNPPAGVMQPNVTPIPDHMSGTDRNSDGIARDAMGNPILSLSDGFQLHTSEVCHDVQFMLELNEQRQGYYENPDMTSDISLNFHPGLNTIRISWDAPSPDRDCRMYIAIKRNHHLRTLTQIRVFGNSPTTGAYSLAVLVQ